MNAYDTHAIRKRHRIGWQEEYLLGMVNAETPLGTMAVLKIAEAQTVMSPATTHKYLHKLIAKKFVAEKNDKEDRRGVILSLSAKGETLLQEIKHAYVGK
jgi:DNA-binding MarR family transcriptional regulator